MHNADKQWDHQLTNVLEFLPEPTMVLDLNGRVVIWNNAMEKVSGVKKEDIIGKGNYEYALPFYNTRRPILIDMVLKNDRAPIEKYTLVERSGNTLYGEIYTPYAFNGTGAYLWGVAAPLMDHSGKIIGAIECMRNVTERKKQEQELRRAKQAAESAAKAKSEFLARMSHEIRTPMNAILGMSELLSGTQLSDEQRDYIDTLQASGEMLLTIINDILDFSKIEEHHVRVENISFDLRDLARETVRMLENRAKEKKLGLSCNVSPLVSHQILGDPIRIKQVLINLLTNAIKFTQEGQVALHIIPDTDADGNEILQFSVSDTGIGISQEFQKRIFDSFAQADTSTTRNFGGTGLGLTISKQLIELMGGKIWIYSRLNEGTTFFFTIPFEKTDLAPVEKLAPQISPEIENLNRLKLLLVEDIATNRKIVRRFLKDTGIQITEAVNGKIALDTYIQEKGRFDIIIMDQEMPVMDGLNATLHIRRYEKEQNIAKTPVIALSAHAFNQYKNELLKAGCNAFITKPVKKRELINALANEISVTMLSPETEDETFIVKIDKELQDLIPEFLDDLKVAMNRMKQALAQTHFSELRRLAHGYKGAAGNYGVNKLGRIFFELEKAARKEENEHCKKTLDQAFLFLQKIDIRYVDI